MSRFVQTPVVIEQKPTCHWHVCVPEASFLKQSWRLCTRRVGAYATMTPILYIVGAYAQVGAYSS
jgi:hypothetical protein